MPSHAYNTFKKSLISDVDELISIHTEYSTGKKGKQSLGHLTRSALILICTAFEQYIEMVSKEYIDNIKNNNALSKTNNILKKSFATFIKGNKHELYCLKLIGEGWKECLSEYIESKIQSFNTPNSENINNLFKDAIGIDISNIFDKSRRSMLDKFIEERGDITHNSANAHYPHKSDVVNYRNNICNIVMALDDFLATESKEILKKQSWKKISGNSKIKTIKN